MHSTIVAFGKSQHRQFCYAMQMYDDAKNTLVIACGALAREFRFLSQQHGMGHVELRCLPAMLHNRPELIPGEVERIIQLSMTRYDRIYVAYADCGTGGLLDRVLDRYGIERLAGPHCYATFAGQDAFGELAESGPGSFYLTDFLVRQFDSLVIGSLGLDLYPELRDVYFAHYERLVYLAQSDDPELTERAEGAARKLGLDFVRISSGYGELAAFVEAVEKGADLGTKDRGLLARHPGPSDCESGSEIGEEATRRALRASYRPRRDARKTHRNRRLSRTMAAKRS